MISGQLGLDPAQCGFEPGLNTDTYKYYLDFASSFGYPYIIIDDGWANPNNYSDINSNISIPELTKYGRSLTPRVGIILWAESWQVRLNVSDLLDHWVAIGAMGIEVDFHQRDDVDLIRFQEQVVAAAAARYLVISLHGTSKPAGMHIKYPNLLTVEAGAGHEYDMSTDFITPRHKLDLALIRSIPGPFDYEGQSMINNQPERFVADHDHPQSQGTRVNGKRE